MNKLIRIFLVLVPFFLPSSVWAHTDEYFDSVEAPHGGQMRMAGPYHLEIITKDKEIILYVTDHANTKIKIDGGISKAIFQTGKKKTTVKLQPAGDNIFKGTGDFTVTPKTKIVVFIKLPDQEAQAARFTPLKTAEKNKQSKTPSDSHTDFHDQHGEDHSDHHKMHQHDDHSDKRLIDQHSDDHGVHH